ncbi:hypothetical protein DEU56DRAFT_828853 [Suillus clintonianus]|uniref:uncharacterized protein n=1 Tax=Suillus clintonianus TaxID=1904413 RepID=UPI001B86E985|nr:uncharacterized protein DEU56DRAFT_828853 [Suillus clintonianus]KAG2123818.1 hypothetical protein DEU56DRAFT_828853 [Suillus clintonianus]
MYTVPILSDPNTSAFIDGSLVTPVYLEKTHPSKPISPHGSDMVISVTDSAYLDDPRPVVSFSDAPGEITTSLGKNFHSGVQNVRDRDRGVTREEQ